MSHIKFFKDITKESVAEAGGKGASLGEMTNAKIPVPPGFVILANAFDRFLEEDTVLKEEISARLKEVNPADTNTVDKASNVIRDVIHDHAMPQDLADEILEAYGELKKQELGIKNQGSDLYVAVRSSATAEDSSIASWAGELETYLNTTEENILERVKRCWSSLFTPRAIFYRHEKNLIDHYVSVAVVIQKMVQSEISGIAFTVHPVTEDPDQMIIEAGYGLGEAVVSGQITPDSYVVSKSEMSIVDVNVATQTRKLVKSVKSVKSKVKNEELRMKNDESTSNVTIEQCNNEPDDTSNEWVELHESEGSKQKLAGKHIIEAATLFKHIEEHYGFPCDIEWAMEGGKLYITQSRPITTLKK